MRPRRPSRALPARWASRSTDPPSPATAGEPPTARPGRPRPAALPLREPTMAQGKKYSDAIKRYDTEALHGIAEALGHVKALAPATFDETVQLVVRSGVDPRKPDWTGRGTVALPAGSGKDGRIAVFATGDAATAAREAGAEFVGAE